MVQKLINVGSVASDATYDSPRTMAIKINDNFSEVYGSVGSFNYIAIGDGAVTRTFQEKTREFTFSVKDFGAVGNGTIDDGPAIQRALNAARDNGGGEVFFPPGTYRKAKTSATLVMYSNTTMAGVGDVSVLFHDDDLVNTRRDLLAADNTANICFRDFKILSTADTYGIETNQSQGLTGNVIDGLRVENVTFYGHRYMSTAFSYVKNGMFKGCRVINGMRDGLRAVNSYNVSVIGNTLINVADDCVALHSLDEAPVIGAGFVVTGNTIESSQTIKILGAKRATISHNTISRAVRTPIEVRIVGSGTEGNTSMLDIDISHNTIQDTFGSRGGNEVIRVRSIPLSPAGLSTQPGIHSDPIAYKWTNAIVGQVSVGSSGVRISNNTISRTLANTSAYSNYGHGLLYDRTGAAWGIDPAITDATYAVNAIVVYGSVQGLQIVNNQVSGGSPGFTAILLTATATSNYPDFIDAIIQGNIVRDWPGVGLGFGNSFAATRCLQIRGNTFNMDPYFRAASHNADNTWTTGGSVLGISSGVNATGAVITDNWFAHCGTAVSPVGSSGVYLRDNFVMCDPIIMVDSASNKGVRTLLPDGDFIIVRYDGDPTSPTFGTVATMPATSAASIPTSGWYAQGHFVRNTAQSGQRNGVLGWHRLTIGTGHVDGTDWRTVRPQVHPGFSLSGKTFSTTKRLPVSGAIAAVDVLYFYPFFIPNAFIFNSARGRVLTGGAGSSIKIGIWGSEPQSSSAGNKPFGAPLFQAIAATATNATTVTPALAGTLSVGWYWMGIVTTGTPPTMLCVSDSEMGWLMGADSGLDALTAIGFSMPSTYASTLPTIASGQTFTAVTTATIPAIALSN